MTRSKLAEPGPILDHLARQVIGAAIEVHRHLVPGFIESVYEHALETELRLLDINVTRQFPVSVRYKGHDVGESRIDMLAEDILVVELKAVESLLPIHKEQIISYLKTTGLSIGLLINFNVALLRDGIQRIVLSH